MKKWYFLVMALMGLGGTYLLAQQVDTVSSKPVKEQIDFNGFFNFCYALNNGKVFLKVNRKTQLEQPFLYVNGLSSGIGSNDIGLDRGQLGNERIVFFKKMGNKLMLIQPNLRYRSSSNNPLEKASIEQAFAQSVLFGFPIENTTSDHFEIDLTPFLMQDTHGVSQRLKRTKQGNYKLDTKRSAVALERTKNFPKNSEFDVMLTFAGNPEGRWIRSVTPSANSVTVHQHHSFIALPEAPMEMRDFDPRSGAIPFTYYDYSTPVNASTRKIVTLRHRLKKQNPEAALSEAVKPIVYYLDNGTPEPVRSALLEGGKWWNQAFESAGYRNAFQIKILPDDADPMDVRYNVIQWVHRSTRGWSYGASVVDPRSGEILKGHVSLGSLRIRQDFMIAQALTKAPYANGKTDDAEMMEMALARIRQLSAHEIGHTLGFAHNFAASTKNRSSVMDYPHPTLSIINKAIDFKNAYATGIGSWDKIAVQYSYSDFSSAEEETKSLNALMTKAMKENHLFITDQDARPLGGAHPKAHLWDNGSSAADEMNHLLQVRQIALNQFSIDQLKPDEPLSFLRDRLVPLYFLHRYQLEALIKSIGGQSYQYARKGDAFSTSKPIAVAEQKESFQTLLKTLEAKELKIPKSIHDNLLPHAFGYGASRESFQSQTGPVFDHIGAANTLSDQIIKMLLHPERASRLNQQKALDKRQLGLSEVISTLLQATFQKPSASGIDQALQTVVQGNVLKHLILLGKSKQVPVAVRAEVFGQLQQLADDLNTSSLAYAPYFQQQIKSFLAAPVMIENDQAPRIPDGSPIGSTLMCN